MDKLIEALTKIIEVKKPWEIKEIQVHQPTKTVNIFIDYKPQSQFKCSECGKESKVYDSSYRVWRHLDICDYRCYLNIKIPRTICKEHGVKVISSHPFGRQNSHYSYKFEEKIISKVKEMSVFGISQEIGEPDSNIWRVIHYYIDKAIKGIDCSKTIRIGVDEKSYKKGHNYISIFTDLDTGNVIYVCEGKGEECFGQFYETLFERMGDPNFVKQISMDMSKSYIAGKEEYFSKAEIIFDKFHIKKALNEAIDDVRKQEVVLNENLKKTKYIWLKKECNLTKEQSDQLSGFLKDATTNTAKAYQTKVAFDQLWSVQSNAVEPMLNKWIDMAERLCLKPILKFIKTVNNHKTGIINSMKSYITNAVAEGLNSVFQLAKARARGFRNINNFINMVYFLGNDFLFNFH